MLLYLMVHGVYPIFHGEESVMFRRIQKGRYRVDGRLSGGVREVIGGMMVKDPEGRVGVGEVMNMGWVRGE